MNGASALVESALAADTDAAFWAFSDGELVSALDEVQQAEARLSAMKLAVVRELDGRGLPIRHGASSTAAWLCDRLRVNDSTARNLVKLASALEKLPIVQATLRSGGVNVEQAQVIAEAVGKLPAEAGPQVATKAEAALVEFAAQFEPSKLRHLGERVLSHVAPHIAEEIERAMLERSERLAHAGRAFTLSKPDSFGRVRLSGWLDVEGAAVVNAALDPLCSPGRPHKTTNVGAASDDPDAAEATSVRYDATGQHTAAAPGHAATAQRDATGSRGADAGVRDDRSPGQRRADALVQVCQLAMGTEQLPENGGDRPQVVVTVAYDAVARLLGAGLLDTGEMISAEAVRRLACDAQLIPVVLSGRGQPLDVGQARRLFTGSLRRALVVRDGGCAFPGCDRPARWADGHHIRHWADGGPTCIENGVLLCGHHHRLIHQGEWEVRLGRDGLPEFIPPAYVDELRLPRRNTYHRRT